MKGCLILMLIIACLTGSAWAATPTAAITGQDFILCYSNSIQGETEPCG